MINILFNCYLYIYIIFEYMNEIESIILNHLKFKDNST